MGVENYKKIYPTEIAYCNTIEEAITDADICLIFTEWPQIREFDVSKFAKLMRNPLVIDGRNCYDLDKIKELDIIHESIGRKNINNYLDK